MKGYLTTEEAGRILGVNASRIRQMLREGMANATKFGKAWVIADAEVKKLENRPKRGWVKGRPRKKEKT